MIRDKLADADYFTRLIAEEQGYIEEDHDNIRNRIDTGGAEASGMASRLVEDQTVCASMAYSRGDPIEQVRQWITGAFTDMKYLHELYEKYPQKMGYHYNAYMDRILYMSYAILYDPGDELTRRIIYDTEFFKPRDPILLAMLSSLKGEPVNREPDVSDLQYQKDYTDLWLAISYTGDARILPLTRYLTGWYKANEADPNGAPGIGAHKKMIRYQGYWCWEAAAVAVMMDIDDTSFRDHEHYPKDLADWARAQKRAKE